MFDLAVELKRITQAVAQVSSPEQQVQAIVDEISLCMQVDVCSLYVRKASGDLSLLASHGLNANRPITIPEGQGLVGLVAKSCHTINLANGSEHPDYYHVRNIAEEQFNSFCGVPLICAGETLGVIVVQHREASALDDRQEAFVTTLAAHIALIIKQLPVAKIEATGKLVLRGVPASDGIALGSAYVISQPVLEAVADEECECVKIESSRWYELLKRVELDLNNEQSSLQSNLPSDVEHLFDTYRMLLLDKTLSDKVIEGIETGKTLAYALRLAVEQIADIFDGLEDEYMRTRAEDIRHVGNKIYRAHIDDAKSQDIPKNDKEDIILCGVELSISDIAAVDSENLKGIVCEAGSRLSHTAIVANALGIPAVMGVEGLLKKVSGDNVIIDGHEGMVFVRPNNTTVSQYQGLLAKQLEHEKELEPFKKQLAYTDDGKHIEFYANSGLLADISPGIKNGAEGIGLFRTEIPFLVGETFPSEEEQTSTYHNVYRQYAGKPIYMRVLDIGSDKQLPYFPIIGEDNPALGWRGIRFLLDNKSLLVTQLRAMLRACLTDTQLNIIVPMVTSSSDLKGFKEVLELVMEQMKEEGVKVKPPCIGIMIEVPAAANQLHNWAEHIDFVSIGTNDLSQYVLAMDRNNPRISGRFDILHPGLLIELNRISKTAKHLGLPVSVCGEMAADQLGMLLLVGMGITRFSVAAARIPALRRAVSGVDLLGLESLVDYALKCEDASQIRTYASSIVNKDNNESIKDKLDGK